MTRQILSAAVIAAAFVAQAGCATAPDETASITAPGRVISPQSSARERTSQDMARTMQRPSCGDNATRGAVC